MELKFHDHTSINVIRIFGKSMFYSGTKRDTLYIHINPNLYTKEYLSQIFHDTNKTRELFTVENNHDVLIGTGYCIVDDISIIQLEDQYEPGTMHPVTYTETMIVAISQLTYDEYQYQENHHWESSISY